MNIIYKNIPCLILEKLQNIKYSNKFYLIFYINEIIIVYENYNKGINYYGGYKTWQNEYNNFQKYSLPYNEI